MGSVYRQKATRPMPAGAEIITRKGKRFAVWTDAAGKKQTAPMTGPKAKREGIVVEAATYSAKYRDAAGIVRRVPTGCTSKAAAQSYLAALVAKAEKVRSGVLTEAEVAVAEYLPTPVAGHIDDYLAALSSKRGKGAKPNVSAQHVANVAYSLRLAVEECGWRLLRDLNREAVERWVRRLTSLPDGERPAPRTINARLVGLTAWGNWLVGARRLVKNPFDKLDKLDEADDIRRQRRALDAAELRALLTVARLRPVAEYGRQRVCVIDEGRPAASRATWKREVLTLATIVEAAERGRERLRPDVLARLDKAGRERELLYAILATTGLRKSELASLTVGSFRSDGGAPVLVLAGADAKNGQRETIQLRDDVAGELRAWLTERTEAAGVESLPADDPLLDVPTGLVRILDRDLVAAGIPKRDDMGRTIDVHALRHGFCTGLFAAGIDATTVQIAMRHSSAKMTKRYLDEGQIDVRKAVASLPAIRQPAVPATPAATPLVTQRGIFVTIAAEIGLAAREAGISYSPRKTCIHPTIEQERATRLELATSSLGSGRTADENPTKTRAKRSLPPAATPVATPTSEIDPTGMAELLLLVGGLEAMPADDRRATIRRIVEATAGNAQRSR